MNATQQAFIRLDVKQEPEHKLRLVRELPPADRPVNRLHFLGANSLSTPELLAAILQSPDALDLAGVILARFGGLIELARAPTTELEKVPGIGRAQAARLKAAMELGRRMLAVSPQEKPQIRTPADTASLLMLQMMSLEQEHMVVIPLDAKNRVIDVIPVYKGSVNTTVVRIGELFRPAILHNASAMVLAHNHPSGDPTPSPEDVQVTTMIVQAGKFIDIDVLDHVIFGCQSYVSLRDRGLGF